MIGDLKPYVDYKDSGLPWIGQVPRHWETRRLRHACGMRVSNVDKHTTPGETPVRLCNYVEVYKNDRIRETTRFMSATASEDERIRFGIREGDVLITKDSEQWNDIGVPALVEFEAPDLVCGYHLAILRPRAGLLGAFLHRVLESHYIAAQFHVEANGVTRYGLSQGAILGVGIPLPPVAEQEAIVRFLDWAKGRIERTIRSKRQVIKLLTEQKQTITYRAVTRGINADIPLKRSGIEWLGDVPQHWEVRRCGSLFVEVVDTGHPTALLLSIDRFKGVITQAETGRKTRASEDRSAYKRARPGQLAYNLMNAFMGSIGFSAHDGIVSPAYAVAKPRSKIEPGYFHELFRTTAYTGEFNRLSYGIMYERNRLYFERFKLVPVLIPPLDEQREIVQAIEKQTAELNETIARYESEIELLREYGVRLVADVVAGRLNVLEFAAGLPEQDTLDAADDSVDDLREAESTDEEAEA